MTPPKTLREWAGLQPPVRLDPKKTAVVLIDFQEEYFGGNVPIPDGAAAVRNGAALAAWADRVGAAVVHVHHVAASEKSPLFTPGTPRVAPHPLVQPAAHHHRIEKRMPSAFVGTELDAWLKARGIETLVVCGLMTHMCVDSTTRDAVAHGYRVIVADDACATRDLPSATGEAVPHAAVHRAVLAGLGDRFADVMPTGRITALA
jgi:nicotinamidase-related amidase